MCVVCHGTYLNLVLLPVNANCRMTSFFWSNHLLKYYGTISVHKVIANICIYLLFRLKTRLVPLHFQSR